MNSTPLITNIMKLQLKPNTNPSLSAPEKPSVPKSITLSVISESNTAVSNDNSNNWKSTNVVKLKQNDVIDMCFKGENLQQLSTNALPPYAPTPPNNTKIPFEVYCCSDCGDSFALKSSLHFHLERRSVLIKFPCETCKSVRIFYNRCTLQSHIRSHADKNEPSAIEKAMVNPLPRVFMDGLQTEFVNTLDDELNCMEDVDEMPATELLEFSLKEDDESIIVKEKSIVPPSNLTKVKCSDCNEEFDSVEARKDHLTNGEEIPVLISQCNKCGMVCPSKCSLKAHQRLHLQVSPYICPECGDSPDAFWANFQHHVKFKCFHHSRSIGYKCPVCKRVSASNESLLKHMELHTEKYLKCDTCPRAYMTMMTFDDHVKEHHSGQSVKFNTIYKCSLCDIVFLSSDQMLAHRSTHLKGQICEYVFNCMQCGKPLENKVLLLEHIKNSHPKIYKHIIRDDLAEAKPQQPTVTYKGKVECVLCHCSFHSYQGYSVHVSRAHINVNQPCSYCFMIIGNRREMVIHGKKHLKKGNIVCLLCNNKKCQDEKFLDAHLSKYHVDKLQYCSACPICNELMPSFYEALNHLRVEHFLVTKESDGKSVENTALRTDVVTCHFCRVSFGNDIDLHEHLRTKHHVDGQKPQNNVFTTEEKDETPTKKQRTEGSVCAKCDFQSTDRETFKKHLLTHKTNKNTFQCQECGLCFVVAPSLTKHLRVIHKISDTKKYIEEEGTNFMPDFKKTTEVFSCDSLICSVCFTTFPTEAQLKTHMRSHGMAFIQANKTITAS